MSSILHEALVVYLSKQSEEIINSSLDNLIKIKLIGKREYKQLLKRIYAKK